MSWSPAEEAAVRPTSPHSCVKLISFLFWILESELLHVLNLMGWQKAYTLYCFSGVTGFHHGQESYSSDLHFASVKPFACQSHGD